MFTVCMYLNSLHVHVHVHDGFYMYMFKMHIHVQSVKCKQFGIHFLKQIPVHCGNKELFTCTCTCRIKLDGHILMQAYDNLLRIICG